MKLSLMMMEIGMSTRIDELVDELSNLGVIDAIELIRKLEKRWGVSATQRIGKFVADVVEEYKPLVQTEFDVILVDTGPRKIEVIKVIRARLALGLKEAKDASENPGCALLQAVSKEEAVAFKEELERAGATIALR
jgi:large subunit ribosomal protein L7/L12